MKNRLLINSRIYLFIELFIIILVPTFLLTQIPALIAKRHLIMLAGSLYILIIASKLRLPNPQTHLFAPSKKTLIFTLLLSTLVSGIILISYLFFPDLLVDPSKIINIAPLPYFAPLILYPLLSVPLQEIIFRWFYINRLEKTPLSPHPIIILSSLVFGAVHLPFGKPGIAVGTFLLGLWWNSLYLKHHNLWLSITSHSIIGNTLIALALFS